jgi:xylulokinase
LIDAQGAVVSVGAADHADFASPGPGWAEQDPRDWWRACQLAVQKMLQQSKVDPAHIACVGLTGQMHGAVVLDAKKEVVRPALIWCDQRGDDEIQNFSRQFGPERLIRVACNPGLTNFTLTKLLWIRHHEPQNWDRIRSIMLPKDYVRLRLTGDMATDVADASGTLLLEVAQRRWSSEILSAAKIPAAWLPALYESSAITGTVSPAAAQLTGLKPGTPVVAGAGDQAAGAVGMGIVRPGSVSVTIGTSGVVFAATERPALDPGGRLHTFCHALPNRWHVMGVTQAAGLSLRWFRDRFGAGTDHQDNDSRDPYARLADEAAKSPPGAEGVFWVPYLMGERTPHLDPKARGAWLGLLATHTRSHLVRAILEGVAFSLKDSFSIFEELKIPVETIRLGGGGARSPLWRQIQSDVYGQEVELVVTEEGAAYGAAILAGVGANHWNSTEQACDAIVRVSKRVAPVPATVESMRQNYKLYRRIYPALRSIFQ